jgi:hypothetical protein
VTAIGQVFGRPIPGGEVKSLATNSKAGTNSQNSSTKSMIGALSVGADVTCVTWIDHTDGARFWLAQHSFPRREGHYIFAIRTRPA